jgi:surfeit locus 1 family protein
MAATLAAAPRRDLSRKAGGAGRTAAATLVAALLFAGFVALGVWQLQRLAWKTDLIDRTAARIHAAPAAAPGPAAWPTVTRSADEYRRIAVRGAYLPGRDTFVQAVTDLGAGYWVLSPLRTDQGFVVLVNRGFVPPAGRQAPAGPPAGEQQVTGLLRITEPHGGFLRANAPAADRWRSRDVAAIAARRSLSGVAPYFIDAQAAAGAPASAWPRAGLTVVRFSNNHLGYAFTWFGMALATVVGWRIALRHGRSGGE